MSRLHLRLLGGFQASLDAIPLDDFPTDKVRALLVYLAIEPGRPHMRTKLATLLWGEWDEKSARSNLRKSLYRLKKVLGDAADSVLTITRSSVQLEVDAVEIDLHHFTRLINSERLADLAEAANLYQGDLLTGMTLPDAPAFNEWLIAQRERLHQQALTLFYQVGELHLANGEYDAAQTAALRQLALEAWHEGAHRQLMRLFDAQGQRAAALAQYDQCVTVLEEELGATPSAETEELLAAIRGEQLLTTHLHNFTAVATPFVGREADINRVIARLSSADARLITLIGPGGIGKTRLAIEAVRRSMGNRSAYFLPLNTVITEDGIWQVLMEQLELKPSPHISSTEIVIRFLRARAPLLVFDNYEQLLPNTSCIERLLADVPDVHILVTSRAPLNLRAEWRLPLDGLDLPLDEEIGELDIGDFAAVELLVKTGQQMRPDFEISSENTPHLIRICRALAGMPLALEMAGSWFNLFTARQLADQIEQNLDFLVATRSDMPERHRSLRAIFDYAQTQLNSAERNLLSQLTLFHGSFSMDAIIAILSASPLTIVKLIDHALLQRRGNNRFGLHPVLDAFLRDDVGKSAEMNAQEHKATRRRHSHFYLTQLSEQGQMSSGTFAVIRRDLDNIRTAWHNAIEWQDSNLIGVSIRALAELYMQLGYLKEAVGMFDAVNLESGNLRTQAQLEQAKFLTQSGQLSRSIDLYEAIIDENENLELVIEARSLLGLAYGVMNKHKSAMSQGKEVLAFARLHSEQLLESKALLIIASIHWRMAQLELAQNAFEEALAIAQMVDDRETITKITAGLALAYMELAEFEKALVIAQEGLTLEEAAGNLEGILLHNLSIGLIKIYLGQFSSGMEKLQMSLQIAEESEMPQYEGYGLYFMSEIHLLLGATDQAEDFANRSLTIMNLLQLPQFICLNLNMLAQVQLRQDNNSQAKRLLEEGMQIADENELPRVQAQLLTTLGELALAENNHDLAGQLLTDAMAILQNSQLRVYMPRTKMLLARC